MEYVNDKNIINSESSKVLSWLIEWYEGYYQNELIGCRKMVQATRLKENIAALRSLPSDVAVMLKSGEQLTLPHDVMKAFWEIDPDYVKETRYELVNESGQQIQLNNLEMPWIGKITRVFIGNQLGMQICYGNETYQGNTVATYKPTKIRLISVSHWNDAGYL